MEPQPQYFDESFILGVGTWAPAGEEYPLPKVSKQQQPQQQQTASSVNEPAVQCASSAEEEEITLEIQPATDTAPEKTQPQPSVKVLHRSPRQTATHLSDRDVDTIKTSPLEPVLEPDVEEKQWTDQYPKWLWVFYSVKAMESDGLDAMRRFSIGSFAVLLHHPAPSLPGEMLTLRKGEH